MAAPSNTHPHGTQPLQFSGAPLAQARAVLIALHGRGGSPQDMLGLAAALTPPGYAVLAPQAARSTWYPYPFLAPRQQNEPWLSSALRRVAECIALAQESGLPLERVALLGFSQGACLALEFAARNPRRYGAVIGLSGGLIGPPGMPMEYPGSLAATPVLMGCSDRDPHIPLARLQESAAALTALGGSVDLRVYPGLGHTVNEDEIERAAALLQALTRPTSGIE